MQSPERWRAIGLAVVVAGVAAAAATAQPGNAGLHAALVCFAAVAVPLGGFVAWERHRDIQVRDALLRGENVLARWHIEADRWREFVELERQAAGPPYNELSVADAIPAGGVDVIVGKEAILVGRSVHRVPGRGTPQVTDAVLREGSCVVDLGLYYPGVAPRFRSVQTRLRFPFASGSLGAAREVVAHYGGGSRAEPDFFHGRGDGSDPEDLSRCWNCGYETFVYRSQCPKCGSGLQSRRWARRFGVGLVLCGLFLTVVMGGVMAATVPMLLEPGRQIGRSTFNGTPGQATMILLLFGGVLAFGLTALGYGAWQMATGGRSLRVAFVLLLVFVALVMAGIWL
jgi:hypothetical protein